MLMASGYVGAASFDCSKTLSKIEVKIYLDAELSQLDSELGELYRSLRPSDSHTVHQQKQWLRLRDSCDSIDCLKRAYLTRISELNSLGACPISDKTIEDNWALVGEGFFEKMAFSLNNGEKLFSSWIHNRLEMTGKWELVDCTIRIVDGSGKISFDYIPKKLENNRLYLIDEDKHLTIYKRLAR